MINIAVIGCGYWGPNLIRNFHSLLSCTLNMCCDLDKRKLLSIESLYPHMRMVTDYSDILNDPTVDAVAIATPPRTHYYLAKEGLQHGKHVFVEKPMTMNSVESQELIEIAERHKRILMVGHTFEYNPAVMKIKELVNAGQIGDLYYIYSTRVNLGQVQRDINALWSIAPHDISILLYLLGNMPLEVSARGAMYLNSNMEDVVFIDLVFPKKITGHIHVSWLDPGKIRKMTIVGSKKMIVYDDVDNEAKIKIYDKGVYKREGDEIFGEFQYRLHSGDIYIPKIDMTEPLKNQCAHFIECIQQGKRPITDGQNGLRVVKVLEAAQKSLNDRGVYVEVKP